MIHGFQTMFNEAWKLCSENDEADKYLMTFQNFLSRVPKWNSTIINTECARIKEASSCNYLEELIACVHVVQLKSLTCMRVGMKNKKINVDVPKATEFIHNAYIHAARKLYANMYLYEKTANTLATQRNRREIELIVKECILNAMRDSIPIEKLIRSYMDPTIEEDVEVSEVTSILKEESVIEPGSGASGVDVDLGSGGEAMPGLAPSKSKLATTTAAASAAAASAASDDTEQASVLERLETERLKTAEARELEAMREILADVDTTNNYSYSSSDAGAGAGAEVKFNDDVMIKSIDSADAEADRESRRGYGDDGDGDGDDDYDSNTLRIGDSVNLDIGAEPVDGEDSVSILDDIQVLS
jgi:hypothetical protein